MKAAVIMGSASDEAKVEKGIAILKEYGVDVEVRALSAHRAVLPVIGIPIKGASLDGMDALLSIVQMPSGIPVATVAIDGAKNAAWLALEIMAIKYPELSEKLKNNRQAMEKACLDTNNEISEKYR